MPPELLDSDLDAVSKSLLINSKGQPPADNTEEEDEDTDDGEEPSEANTEEPNGDEEQGEEEAQADDEESGEVEDIDEVEIDVVVDGETKQVKLKDLKARYSGEAAIDRRLQEATEAKSKVLQVGNALYKTLNEQAQRLNQMDEFLKEQIQPNINWEELRAKDPGKYLLERDKHLQMEERRRRVEEEKARIKAQQDELDALAYQDYTEKQVQELARKVPEITDPEKSKQIMEDLSAAASFYGLAPEELAAVVDHRHLMVLIDAARYRKMMAEKSGKVPNKKLEQLKPRPLLKAGTNKSNPMTSAKKTQLAALKRAKATGSVDDIAKMLVVRK